MKKDYRRFASHAVVSLITMLIASCGSGSSDEGLDGPAEPGTSEGDSSSPTVVPPDVLPLVSSEGAESGFEGCLNRPLYFNGPHFVSTTHEVTNTSAFGVSTSSEQIDRIHTVTDVSAEGIAQVEIETTLATSSGTGGSFTTPYTLNGYKLSPTGAPDNNPLVIDYSLEEGVSVTQVLGTEFGAVADTTRTYTYVGRETVNINGTPVDACRVDSETRNETDRPEFRFEGYASRWYAVGSGLLLKRVGTSFPDSEDDVFSSETVLTFGSINSESMF